MKVFHILFGAILFIGMAGIAPVAAELTTISQGGVAFVGEEGLTFLNGGVAVPAGTVLEWYASGDTPGISVPSATYTCQGTGNEVIAPSIFQTRTGNWYLSGTATAVIKVLMPSIDIKAFNSATAEDMTNERVVKTNTYITFRLDSNIYEGIMSRPNYVAGDITGIKVILVDEEGTVYTALFDDDIFLTTSALTNLVPTTSQFYLPSSSAVATTLSPNWALDLPDYKTGVYTFYAQVNLNNAKDNVGTVTGVTKSNVYTLEVGIDDVKVEANKDTVVRNNDFSVTITGRPNEYYVLWVKGTSSITAPDTAPYIKSNQDNVFVAGSAQGNNAGIYQFRAGQSVASDVSVAGGDGYAMVKLSSSGTRTVGFGTDETTKDYSYTIRTDYFPGNPFAVPPVTVVASNPTSDITTVNIEKGCITILTSGDGLYYMGEEIALSGTNTDSDYTWLFITGPNLPTKGGSLEDPYDGVNSAKNAAGIIISPFYPDGQLDSFAAWRGKSIGEDNTWNYIWDTKGETLDAGTYAIYAVTTATNKDDLSAQEAIYDIAFLAIRKPFVTVTTSPANVAKGTDFCISGIATGDPVQGIAVWVLGKNCVSYTTETVEETGTFTYRFTNTEYLGEGQYNVVVQHPMYNDQFDLVPQNNNPTAGQTAVVRPILDAQLQDPITFNLPPVFILEGAGSLQGSDAATALVNAMNNPDIDDTCYELTFMIQEPWITVNDIGERHVGEIFIISGTTNLAVGDKLLIELTSLNSSAVPNPYGTALITKGETDEANSWGFIIDTSAYTPDNYTITVEWIGATAQNATQNFTLLEANETPLPSQSITLPISRGWNLISTPVDTQNINITGYLYETAYAYNTTTGSYTEIPLIDIVAGEGYWIGAFADAEIEFSGNPLIEYQKTLFTGWNLVGSIGIETEIGSIYADPDALSGPIYRYNPENRLYTQATSLEPGLGYWALSSETCTITVNITPPVAPA